MHPQLLHRNRVTGRLSTLTNLDIPQSSSYLLRSTSYIVFVSYSGISLRAVCRWHKIPPPDFDRVFQAQQGTSKTPTVVLHVCTRYSTAISNSFFSGRECLGCRGNRSSPTFGNHLVGRESSPRKRFDTVSCRYYSIFTVIQLHHTVRAYHIPHSCFLLELTCDMIRRI